MSFLLDFLRVPWYAPRALAVPKPLRRAGGGARGCIGTFRRTLISLSFLFLTCTAVQYEVEVLQISLLDRLCLLLSSLHG